MNLPLLQKTESCLAAALGALLKTERFSLRISQSFLPSQLRPRIFYIACKTTQRLKPPPQNKIRLRY